MYMKNFFLKKRIERERKLNSMTSSMHLKKIIKPNYGNTFNDDLDNKNKIVRMFIQ